MIKKDQLDYTPTTSSCAMINYIFIFTNEFRLDDKEVLHQSDEDRIV